MPIRLEIDPVHIADMEEAIAHEKSPVALRWLMGVRLVAMKHSTAQVAQELAVSQREVRRWVHRFREGGVEAMRPQKRPGPTPRLSEDDMERFKERIRQGPTQEDGFTAWRGPVTRAMLRREFGVEYGHTGVYVLLHRAGFSSLMPRPQHPESSPEAQEAFQKKPCPTPTRRRGSITHAAASKSGSRTRRASGSKAP